MNAKYVVALILALQVSMSLCDVQQPSQELVDKYSEMRTLFLRRLANAYNKIHSAAAPMMEGTENGHGQRVKEFIEDLQTKPEFQSLIKVLTSLGSEATPLVDKARVSLLGLYEQHLRAYIGPALDEAINSIKPLLNKYLPAE